MASTEKAAPIPAGRFVDQTILYKPGGTERGNCTEAAVASALGIPLSEVPDFRANGTEAHKFWSAFRRFIRSRGFEPIMLPGNHCHDVLYLASGPSPRGVNHMVVMKSGKLVHDPHPSKAGIGEVETVWLLVPHDCADRDSRIREEERLSFEDNLDDWMKILGAGVSGYQPEAYAVMDAACKELASSRGEILRLVLLLMGIRDYRHGFVDTNVRNVINAGLDNHPSDPARLREGAS